MRAFCTGLDSLSTHLECNSNSILGGFIQKQRKHGGPRTYFTGSITEIWILRRFAALLSAERDRIMPYSPAQ